MRFKDARLEGRSQNGRRWLESSWLKQLGRSRGGVSAMAGEAGGDVVTVFVVESLCV